MPTRLVGDRGREMVNTSAQKGPPGCPCCTQCMQMANKGQEVIAVCTWVLGADVTLLKHCNKGGMKVSNGARMLKT